MLDQIMEVLTPRRMMTVGNLALQFEMEPAELHPRLEQLDAEGRIRYALSKCDGVCSTCSTCSTTSSGIMAGNDESGVDPTAIVISLELRKTDD
ncbi:FeoC-like transcriptional regulator [Pontiellaceae bacterium B12227]|nr:FeoC-like transcriptional regulator [Pontiellaceae bacterium B12227]